MKKLFIIGKAVFLLFVLFTGQLTAQPDDLELRNVSIVSAKSYTAINTVTVKENFVVGDGGEVAIGAPKVFLLPDVKVADGGTLYIVSESIALSNGPQFNPLGLELAESFPNPFSDQLRITYSLDQPGELRVSILDLRGRMIHKLYESKQYPGAHQLLWEGEDTNGRKVSSGIYLIRFQTDEFQLSRRVYKLP
ncbi:MAG: T9SS type A sorting domain-containing protein [Bacteroidota bacterium]